MDFATFVSWCSENGLDPVNPASRTAYMATLEGPASEKRSRKATDMTILCLGRRAGVSGEELFKRAVLATPQGRTASDAKKHVANVLVWEAKTAGYDSARCVVVSEEISLS